jgi:hypothetical protein
MLSVTKAFYAVCVFILNVIMLKDMMLNVIMLSVIMLNVIMQSVIMLNVIMLSVIMLSVIMLSVAAPTKEAVQLIFFSLQMFIFVPVSSARFTTSFLLPTLECYITSFKDPFTL